MTSRRTITFVVALALGATGTAQAQELLQQPRQRQGYYMGGGLRGAGTFGWENGDNLGLWNGSGIALRFGEMLTPRLGLGLDLEFGGTTGKGQNAGYFTLGLEGNWNIVSNLSANAVIGLGVLQLQDPKIEDEDLRGAVGGIYGLGLSYDLFPWDRRSGGFAITPTLQARFLPGEETKAFEVLVGVDLLWWSGLPRNQLELPPDEAFKK
jgi:hypothetical protein